MLRFISKLNDDLKYQLFILCSATSRYLATITAQLMLRNVVPNSLTSRFIHFLKLFRQKFDNRRADQNLSAAACRIYRRRRRTGGGAHVCLISINICSVHLFNFIIIKVQFTSAVFAQSKLFEHNMELNLLRVQYSCALF